MKTCYSMKKNLRKIWERSHCAEGQKQLIREGQHNIQKTIVSSYGNSSKKQAQRISAKKIDSSAQSKSHMAVSSVVEWLKHCDCDRHGLTSKPISAILLCA